MNRLLLFSFALIFLSACSKTDEPQAVAPQAFRALVFSATNGYRHESIPAGKAMLQSHAGEWKIAVDTTEDPTAFNNANLANYQLIILLSNTGNNLSESQRQALRSFVRKGGRVLGIHSASDAEYDWGWYGEMIGARFLDHPAIQQATCEVTDAFHPSVRDMVLWTRSDEWYNYYNLQKDNEVVLVVREDSYQGGAHPGIHPISWHRNYDGGKVFYTAMGHTVASYSEPLFIQHIGGAIEWLLAE